MNTRININDIYDTCTKQKCSCSKKEDPHYKYRHNECKGSCDKCNCPEFNKSDFGCWRFAVGKKPVKLCLDECECVCHEKIGELNAKK